MTCVCATPRPCRPVTKSWLNVSAIRTSTVSRWPTTIVSGTLKATSPGTSSFSSPCTATSSAVGGGGGVGDGRTWGELSNAASRAPAKIDATTTARTRRTTPCARPAFTEPSNGSRRVYHTAQPDHVSAEAQAEARQRAGERVERAGMASTQDRCRSNWATGLGQAHFTLTPGRGRTLDCYPALSRRESRE